MNKFLITTLLLVFSSSFFFAQTNEVLKERALRDAKIASKATLEGDYKTVLKHTYPTVVEMMGGTAKATEIIKSMFAEMGEQGFVFEKADVQFVSDVVFEQNEYRCYTQSMNVMKMNNMRINSKSYLFGFYDAEKEYWYFVEAAKMKNTELMDQLFPDFQTNMLVPEAEMDMEEIKD